MTWLNHVKIGRRLVIVFGIIGAILLTVGAGALWSQRAMSQANRASLDELEISNLVGQFTSELFAVRLVLPAIIIPTRRGAGASARPGSPRDSGLPTQPLPHAASPRPSPATTASLSSASGKARFATWCATLP